MSNRKQEGGWTGFDMLVRRITTPAVISASVLLAVGAMMQAMKGERMGDSGGYMVLIVFVAMALKLVAESYLFSYLGSDPSPKQRAAQLMTTRYARLTGLRYLLGALGGIVLPLGAQILAVGSKNIPEAATQWPSAIAACLAVACLLTGEAVQRRLFYKTAVAPLSQKEVG